MLRRIPQMWWKKWNKLRKLYIFYRSEIVMNKKIGNWNFGGVCVPKSDEHVLITIYVLSLEKFLEIEIL